MLASRQETADLVTITKEILNGKLHFLCSVNGSGKGLGLTLLLANNIYVKLE